MPIDSKLIHEAADFYAKNARMPPWFDVPADAASRLLHQAPAMYELLKEIEFAPDMSYGSLCPICRQDGRRPQNNGHAPDCRLAAVLKAVEGGA